MALHLPITNIDYKRFLKVPWTGGPDRHDEVLVKPPVPGGPSIALCSPFHGEYAGGPVTQRDLDQVEEIGKQDSSKALAKARDDWRVQRDSAGKTGDSPFWGPGAFQEPSGAESLAVTPLGQLTWRQSISTSSASENSHFSGALGVGVGNSFLGASITGKYDKVVATLQDASKDSVSVRYADSVLQLELNSRPLTTEARQLLQEYGPEMFQTFFGTHFVSGFVIGCESGYCISMQTDKRDEIDEFSIIAEIHVLFWTISVEAKVAEHIESSLKLKPSITSYDTLAGIFDQSGPDDLTPDKFTASSVEIRARMKSLPARVAAAKATKSLDSLILEIVVSPWSALREWHEGCDEWHAKIEAE